MVNVRKTSNVIPFGKVGPSKSVNESEQGSTSSPFAIKPADPLKALTDRKSTLAEEQKLAILQRALHPFANEARKHLPTGIGHKEKAVRKKMLDEGFSEVVASEAGEEAAGVLLEQRRVVKTRSQHQG